MPSFVVYIGVAFVAFAFGAALISYLDTAHCSQLESRCFRQELTIERLKSEAAQRGDVS